MVLENDKVLIEVCEATVTPLILRRDFTVLVERLDVCERVLHSLDSEQSERFQKIEERVKFLFDVANANLEVLKHLAGKIDGIEAWMKIMSHDIRVLKEYSHQKTTAKTKPTAKKKSKRR